MRGIDFNMSTEILHNLGIVDGSKGETGSKGEKGDTGPKGDIGPMGPKGVPGDVGPTGPQGLTGPQGEKGDKGDTGAIGPKGDIGPAGPQGEKGETGTTLFTYQKADTVSDLPATGESGIIYIVPNSSTGSNSFDNYVWVDGKYDSFGELKNDFDSKADKTDTYTKAEVDTKLSNIDLSSYYTKTEIDTTINNALTIIKG